FIPTTDNTYNMLMVFSKGIYSVVLDKLTLKVPDKQKNTFIKVPSTNFSSSTSYSTAGKTHLFVSTGKKVMHLSNKEGVFIQNQDSITFSETISTIAVTENDD